MLIPITEADGVLLDLRYATADNLTGAPFYRRPVALLVPEAAAALRRAVTLAAPLGLRLVLFDAFRPIEGQWALWRALPDPEFISDPRKGGIHTRGVAADVTLADAATGRALDMGTGFDAITPRSHHGRTDIPVPAQRHRALLLGLMTAAGWDCYLKEWWHYQLFQPRRYPPLAAAAVPGGPM